jgi:hypothetical protein
MGWELDPFFKISYQELGRDWAALAEEAEWLDSHQLPSPAGSSRSCVVEDQLSMSGNGAHELEFSRLGQCNEVQRERERSAARNAPPLRLSPKSANTGKE